MNHTNNTQILNKDFLLWPSGLQTQLVSMRTQVRSLTLINWLGGSDIAVSCGVGHRCSLDPMLWLPWLWYRLEAVALTQPRAWEPPYAMGVALKRQKKMNIIKFSTLITPYCFIFIHNFNLVSVVSRITLFSFFLFSFLKKEGFCTSPFPAFRGFF